MIRNILGERSHLIALRSGFLRWQKQTMSLSHSAQINVPTAGIIVIGDEILKGQVHDTNSHFIISKLYNIGVRVMKVSVIGDDIDEISNEVRKFSRLYTYVITSGGIGPTHDDVTFEGVAKAFQETTFPHPELLKICSEFYKTTDLSSPAMKLACVPKSAKLKYGFDPVQNSRAKYPNVSVENVYIFPGVPPLLEKSFTMLCEDLFGGSGSKFYKADLFIDGTEVSIAEHLSKAVAEFPSVSFGSYPQHDNRYFQVKLTVEANNPKLTSEAVNRLRTLLPAGCLVDFDAEPLQSAYEKIESLGSQTGMSHITIALKEMLQNLSHMGPMDAVLCVDSSHEGVATLHLLHAVQSKLQRTNTSTVLIRNRSGASKTFIDEFVSRYALKVIEEQNELDAALSTLSSLDIYPKLVIMGCKCSSLALQEFSKSKNILVFSPLSSWNESQIMQFITKLNLPYLKEECSAK